MGDYGDKMCVQCLNVNASDQTIRRHIKSINDENLRKKMFSWECKKCRKRRFRPEVLERKQKRGVDVSKIYACKTCNNYLKSSMLNQKTNLLPGQAQKQDDELSVLRGNGVILVLHAEFDDNGAIPTDVQYLEALKEFGVEVIYKKNINNVDMMKNIIKEINIPILHLIIVGHGNENGMVLSSGNLLNFRNIKSVTDILKPKLHRNAHILLHSCCVGTGGKGKGNFAQVMANLLVKHLVIGANGEVPTNTLNFYVDDREGSVKARLFNVRYIFVDDDLEDEDLKMIEFRYHSNLTQISNDNKPFNMVKEISGYTKADEKKANQEAKKAEWYENKIDQDSKKSAKEIREERDAKNRLNERIRQNRMKDCRKLLEEENKLLQQQQSNQQQKIPAFKRIKEKRRRGGLKKKVKGKGRGKGKKK